MIAHHGNTDVVAALERLLEEAREGNASYLVAAMLTDGRLPRGGWFGSVVLEKSAVVALDEMAAMMKASLFNKQLPPRADDTPADRVCYNVPAYPLSFDFVNWLLDAEMTRAREGAPGPLKVAFWLGRDGKSGLDRPERRQMFDNVIVPMLALVGAVEDPSAVDGRSKAYFASRDVLANARAGEAVPKFRAPAAVRERMARRFGDTVTITLREAGHYPHRNSNLDAWLKFACYLKDRGERVVFVRDTAFAHEPVEGFETCAEASLDLQARAALYQIAKQNMLVSNGPVALCYFSAWPYISMTKIMEDGHPYAPNTPKFWREELGLEVGTQFPWARPNQRIVWKLDDYDDLVEAWDDVMVRC